MLILILILNTIWFSLGFHLFALRSTVFAKIIVPKAERDTPVFDKLVATGPFLGGFNLAFAALNIIMIWNTAIFPSTQQNMILLAVFALAHGTQFLANVPIAIENRKGAGVWQVTGLMRFIFVTDFVLMLANIALVIRYGFS